MGAIVSTSGAWRCVAAVALVGACGGSGGCGGEAFQFGPSGDAGSDATDMDAGAAPDAEPDVPLIPTNVVLCPNQPCRAQTCCTSPDAPNASNCTGGECGCSTALTCASDANCAAGALTVCCIGMRNDSACGSGHPVSACKLACAGNEVRMCDPNASRCPGNRICSTDPGDLKNAGLPAGEGYGVCH